MNGNDEIKGKLRDRQLSCEEAEAQKKYASLVREYNSGKKRYAYVQTFGCQQNEADSELLAGLAADMGYEPSCDPDKADLILVMDNGRIVDQGSHAQLLRSSQIYREVYESQNKAGEEDAS